MALFTVILMSVPWNEPGIEERTSVAILGLLWPHVAYWIASRKGASPDAERRNVFGDAVFGGLVAAALSFRLWPLAVICGAGFVNSLTFGGPRLFVRVVASFVASAVVWAIVLGAGTHLDTEPLPTFLSFASILCYVAFISGTTYRLRVRQRQTRAALEREEAKSQALLANVFPQPVIPRLRAGESPIADQFADVTVVFIDMVEFTPLAERLGPKRTVLLLNDLFHRFDQAAREHGVEKIETTGDGYLAVAGAPASLDDHPQAAARFALAALDGARAEAVEVRIGLHTGPIYGGVIGESRFHYKIFGDTVNTASRVQSHSQPGRILVSEATQKRIAGAYTLQEHGIVELKGRGPMRLYWLL